MPKSKDKLVYRGVDMSGIVSQTIGGNTRQSEWFKVEEFDTPYQVRVLPPAGDMGGDVWVEHLLHYKGVWPNSSGWDVTDEQGKVRKKAITCRAFHYGDRCPVCDLRAWAKDNGDLELEEGLRPKKQRYIQLIDREDGKVKKYTAPAGVIKGIQTLLTGQVGPKLVDPVHGRDIIIRKTGNPKKPSTIEYSVEACLKKSKINHGSWQEDGMDLTNLIREYTDEEVLAILEDNLGDEYSIGQILGSKVVSKKTAKKKVAKKTAKATAKGRKR